MYREYTHYYLHVYDTHRNVRKETDDELYKSLMQ